MSAEDQSSPEKTAEIMLTAFRKATSVQTATGSISDAGSFEWVKRDAFSTDFQGGGWCSNADGGPCVAARIRAMSIAWRGSKQLMNPRFSSRVCFSTTSSAGEHLPVTLIMTDYTSMVGASMSAIATKPRSAVHVVDVAAALAELRQKIAEEHAIVVGELKTRHAEVVGVLQGRIKKIEGELEDLKSQDLNGTVSFNTPTEEPGNASADNSGSKRPREVHEFNTPTEPGNGSADDSGSKRPREVHEAHDDDA